MPEENGNTEKVQVHEMSEATASKLDVINKFGGGDYVADILKELPSKEVEIKVEGEPAKKEAPAAKEEKQPEEEEEIEVEDIEGEEPEAKQARVDAAKEVKEKAAEAKKAADEAEKNRKKNPLGINVKGKKEVDIDIEKFEQITEIAKNELGFDVKDIKGLPKLIKTAKEWKAQATKGADAEKKVKEFTDFFTNLPQDIADTLVAFDKGEDYRKTFIDKAAKFDFNTPADKQDVDALIAHYLPGETVEKEDEDGKETKEYKVAKRFATEKFLDDKKAQDKQRADMLKDGQAKLESRKLSVAGSVKSLKESYTDIAPDAEKDIVDTMTRGDIMSLFVNRDGTYKPEAAEMLMFAKYGKETISDLIKQAEHKAETKANEEILTRGADRKKPTGGGDNKEQPISKETAKFLSSIGANKPKEFTY